MAPCRPPRSTSPSSARHRGRRRGAVPRARRAPRHALRARPRAERGRRGHHAPADRAGGARAARPARPRARARRPRRRASAPRRRAARVLFDLAYAAVGPAPRRLGLHRGVLFETLFRRGPGRAPCARLGVDRGASDPARGGKRTLVDARRAASTDHSTSSSSPTARARSSATTDGAAQARRALPVGRALVRRATIPAARRGACSGRSCDRRADARPSADGPRPRRRPHAAREPVLQPAGDRLRGLRAARFDAWKADVARARAARRARARADRAARRSCSSRATTTS